MGETFTGFSLLTFETCIMKNLFFLLLLICCFQLHAQKLDFNQINSSNILSLLNPASVIQNNSASSKTAVIQLGNNNTSNIYDVSKKSNLLIRQTGDFNTTLMTNTNTQLENKQKVNIEGDNNYIDITGNNSNSKEMQINLKANDKMIFVRHY